MVVPGVAPEATRLPATLSFLNSAQIWPMAQSPQMRSASSAPDPILPNLKSAELRTNPLGNSSYEIFPSCGPERACGHSRISLLFDSNTSAPVFTSRIPPQGIVNDGSTRSLLFAATDLNGDPLTFSAFSDNPNVQVGISSFSVGGPPQLTLNITPAPGFTGLAHVTFVVGDRSVNGQAAGRTSEYTFDVMVNTGAIYGSKYADTNQNGTRDPGEPGIEGWQFFLDVDGDGVLDLPRNVSTFTGNIQATGFADGAFITDSTGIATFSVLNAQTGGPLLAFNGTTGQVMAALDGTNLVFGSNTPTDHWWGYLHGGSLRVDFATAVNQVTATVGYAALFGVPISRPTIIAHDQYGRVIGQASIDLAPTDASKDVTFSSATSNISWVEITAPSNSEPVLIKGVRYANTTGRVPGELLTTTDSNGDYSFTGLAPGNYSVQEILLNAWKPISPSVALNATFPQSVQGFTATGPWHLTTGRGTDPGHSGTGSFYFGNDATALYNLNSNGTLTSPLIDLSKFTGPISLDFNYFLNAIDLSLGSLFTPADFSNGGAASLDGYTLPSPSPWHVTARRFAGAGKAGNSLYFGNDTTGTYGPNQTGTVLSAPIDLRGLSGRVSLQFAYYLSAVAGSVFLPGDIASVSIVDGATRTVLASNNSGRTSLSAKHSRFPGPRAGYLPIRRQGRPGGVFFRVQCRHKCRRRFLCR